MVSSISREVRFNKLFDGGIKIEEYQSILKRGKRKFKSSQDQVENLYLPVDHFSRITTNLKIMVIGAIWCSDSIIITPVVADLAERIPNCQYAIVDKDKYHDEFKSLYTTGGKERVPVVVFATEKGEEITRWVEKSLLNAKIRWRLKQEKLPKKQHEKKFLEIRDLSPDETAQQTFVELTDIVIRISYDL